MKHTLRPALRATCTTALIALTATPLRAQDGVVPLASLPPAPPPVGLPQLQSSASCPGLQQRLLATIGSEAPVWSVTVADGNGRLLADVNGARPRIPASNQKLISTAYALDRLGPDFRLKTQLWRLSDGTLRLTGSGDPDLGLAQLQRFAKLALGSGGSSSPAPSLVRLQLAEEPQPSWWPQGWGLGDRAEAYGAPITRLALTSNAIEMAIPNPVGRLQRLLQQEMARQGGKSVQISLVPAQANVSADMVLLHEEPSAPMHDLLSLANTESHNFTAEVLLRSASGSWNLPTARQLETQWLYQQGLPMAGVTVADGSGLDRANRLTSRLLAALLVRMAQHPYAANYQASMAIAGRRGTLRNLYKGTSLEGRFRGKTGTISGVRSISGVLDTSDGPRYVSTISNGASAPNTTIGRILTQVQNVSLCQPPA
ncbi:D-alanyl-D-alanine carboxypeptidase/D-alanyl-D-alanine-endopeptidase [Cyanobium sp. Morenito 9A2]|uniref:D-alanyl-D-alanine carboxypeptidase/D-alanyl-D-alanine endopeptidase n=1 Tax=Cyanobium sp. Morenito 9A2 TaxID=2823718 RepID=UPI0020CC0209|nr:D-alanyl-D-alanine carboxypeptidase/D-alanyl-D-alanine-endopeptidase [Cyanobium sp. Morenito 9A2]MCP9850077.1 D-alanyl-D-alanine carboxypeptidase/D-alanyl-D-alanine-endopeptidase [Cyanobium sp. Morenito 9A2]